MNRARREDLFNRTQSLITDLTSEGLSMPEIRSVMGYGYHFLLAENRKAKDELPALDDTVVETPTSSKKSK